jgi:hypothetical protein
VTATLGPHVKACVRVTKLRALPAAVDGVVATAQAGQPGPVALSLPWSASAPRSRLQPRHTLIHAHKCRSMRWWGWHRELSVPEVEGRRQAVWLETRDWAGFAVRYMLASTYATTLLAVDAAPQRASVPCVAMCFSRCAWLGLTVVGGIAVRAVRPSATHVREAVRLLRGAARPVVIVGSQAALEVDVLDGVHLALGQAQLPTYLYGRALGLLPTTRHDARYTRTWPPPAARHHLGLCRSAWVH